MSLSEEVDSHFHVWELDRFSYSDKFFNSDLGPIFRTITFPELTEALDSAGVRHAVFIQCLNNNIAEAKWVLESGHPALRGVVAGVDLTDTTVLTQQLDELCGYEKFVGVRHILDWESDPDWVVRGDVIEGLKLVAERDKTFDFLARPHNLQHVATLARAIPDLRIVIDHIAKPLLSKSLVPSQDWIHNMDTAAECPNVFCKLSGLVTEVDPELHSTSWSRATFEDHVQHVLQVFGTRRCMVGSDWPVLRITGAKYNDVNTLHKSLLAGLNEEETRYVCGGNAVSFYKLKQL